MLGLFVFGVIGAILYGLESRRCPSCGQGGFFPRKLLGKEGVDAFEIRFQEGEAPSSHAIRSTFAAKLDLDENDVFVDTMKNRWTRTTARVARVALPKNALPIKVIPERAPTIWGPEGTGPARGWWARMAQAQERTERRLKHLERTFSELWSPKKVGDAADLVRWECKACEHTWTELRVYSAGD